MNKKQKLTILIGVVVIVLMLVVPPWKATRNDSVFANLGFGDNKAITIGYAPIFDPPSNDNASIDGTRLIIQLIAVVMVGGVAFALLRKSYS